ncbi:AAA domain-containing protein [Caenimonas terrae]|uniref:AAA domain-containing protein n=1 Tax=Caenimonas terrae TaxID=696074 RepID=A0ABW0NFB3_9BURK
MSPRAFSMSDFELSSVTKDGGMARVQKATIKDEDILVALKGRKPGDFRDEAVESFNRELHALERMDHPNIVKLLGVGTDGVERFLVLEWLEETLAERIDAYGPTNWNAFYELLGRPILEGIRYAHGRGFAHRDLKPWNVMLDKKGVPKITDFGIAKAADGIGLGLTFARASSSPWTPSESTGSNPNESRDIYSWAAIAVGALTGRLTFKTSEELRIAASKLSAVAPTDLLLRCLGDDKRPGTATELLWELDDYHKARGTDPIYERTIGVDLAPKVHEKLPDLVEGAPDEQIARLLNDFNFSSQVFLLPEGDWEFTGNTLCVRATRASEESPWLMIKDVWPAVQRPASAVGTSISVRFAERVASGVDPTASRGSLEFIQRFLSSQKERDDEEQRRKDEERFLNMLQDVLIARTRALRFLPELQYEDGKWDGGEFSVIVDEEHGLLPGERRVIRGTSGVIVFEFVTLALGRVILRPFGAVRGQPPTSGRLQADTAAQRRALERQEDALKTLRDDNAVSPSLKRLILTPAAARAPEQSGRPNRDDLSPDKAEVLDAALGAPELMVVQGPPGTGKTRLITAIVSQYLAEQPGARVLVAAQTHIAIDHVVEKLLSMGHLPGEIVRIARVDEDKVSPAVRPTLLQNCLAEWCESTARRARTHSLTAGVALGIDSTEVELLVRAEALLQTYQHQATLARDLARIGSELDAAQSAAVEAKADETQKIETATAATVTAAELQEQISRSNERVLLLREELRLRGPDGLLLSNFSAVELGEYISVLQRNDSKWTEFRRVVALQVAWLDLLGQLKQFEEVVMRSASVVAGTCVGLASNDAFSTARFDLCIIDEASKASATEALVPLVRSARALIVGDPKQLPPFWDGVETEGYSESEVKETLLDYLLPRLPASCVKELTHQHRMCKSIGELISVSFYGRSLINDRPDSERPEWIKKRFPKPVVWLDTTGARDLPQGHSFVNPKEQQVILDLLNDLQRQCDRTAPKLSVAVIAGYAAQANALDRRIPRGHLSALDVEVATVDSFQGREASVCIFSATLSNTRDYLGFLRSVKRLNVALSRPQDLLVIVGDQSFCYGVPGENPFKRVIDHMEANPKTCETRYAGQ